MSDCDKLAQAERERDTNFVMWERAHARLAKVPALVEQYKHLLDFAEEGWGYASDYFRDKWNYEAEIADHRAALAAWEDE